MENSTDQQKTVLAFGTKQALSGKTPNAIKWIYRIVGLTSMVFALIVTTYPEIPAWVQLQVYRATGLATGILYIVCNMFGWVNPKDAANDSQ